MVCLFPNGIYLYFWRNNVVALGAEGNIMWISIAKVNAGIAKIFKIWRCVPIFELMHKLAPTLWIQQTLHESENFSLLLVQCHVKEADQYSLVLLQTTFFLSFCLQCTAPLPMRYHLPELLFMFLFLTRSCSKNNIWTNVNEIFWCWSKITEWKLLVVHYTIQHILLPSCSLFWVYIHVRIRNRQVNMNLLTARLYESQRVIIPLNARALGDPNFTSLDWPIKCQVWLNTYWELRRLIMDHSIAGALLIIGRY